MTTEVLIPPDIKPESPARFELIDDLTTVFAPSFARGVTQRQSYGDPRWRLKLLYRGLRQEDRSRIQSILNNVSGRLGILRVVPPYVQRGSFSAPELLTNNTFANGTTGWTAYLSSIAVQDRVLRALSDGTSNTFGLTRAGVSISQYVPYAMRVGVAGSNVASFIAEISGTLFSNSTVNSSSGLATTAAVFPDTSVTIYGYHNAASVVARATSYLDIGYMSLARCALVDNGPNSLLRSDELENAAWDLNGLTVTANNSTAPDGTATGDSLVEDTANSEHFTEQNNVTVSSAAQDIAFAVALNAANRSWFALRIVENTGPSTADLWFNVSTGAVGSSAAGTNWSNIRGAIVPLGNGWFYCCIVARKTNAATVCRARIAAATADAGGLTFTGNGLTAGRAWRATMAVSSVPTRLVQTTTALTTGTSPTGSAMHVKGLPASTNGLLLPGDMYEVGGEVKVATASLNSDAAGLGYLQGKPSLFNAPADNAPVIILNPMGRFTLSDQVGWDRLFGLYDDATLTLEEVYE